MRFKRGDTVVVRQGLIFENIMHLSSISMCYVNKLLFMRDTFTVVFASGSTILLAPTNNDTFRHGSKFVIFNRERDEHFSKSKKWWFISTYFLPLNKILFGGD